MGGFIGNRKLTYAGEMAPELDNWASIAKAVRSGRAAELFSIGEQLITPWTYNGTTYDAPQNICHFSDSEKFSEDNGKNATTGKGMILQWHYATPYDIPFDAPEALYAAPEGGLRAGVYYFIVTNHNDTINGKTYMFELTKDLTEGQQLMLSAAYDNTDWAGTYIRVYDSPYNNAYNTGYGVDGNMELSEWDGESGSPLSGDASSNSTDGNGELNHIARVFYGYNRWSQSAIRQWLNSAAQARNASDTENYPGWWTPQNKYDRIPSQAFTYPGFLAGYEDDFIAAMKPVKVVTDCNTVTDGGVTDVTYDKVFLPSLTQMNIESQVVESETWDYYKELFAANPVSGRTNWAKTKAYDALKSYSISAKATAASVQLRSAHLSSANYAWYVHTGGTVYNGRTILAVRARPACVIG